MANEVRKKIVFQDGSEYYGYGFGDNCERVCEIVFDTAMAGYQEMMSDLSFTDKIVVMTYPLIGNYGVADEDFEAKVSTLGGLVVREYNDIPSNFRYTKTLSEEMEENHIPGIWGVDTREITRKIRDNGSQRVILTNADVPTEKALEIIKNTPVETDAVAKVSCKKRWYSRTTNAKYNVVAVDCGIKLNIIRLLNARGCNVTVVPYNTSAKEIIKIKDKIDIIFVDPPRKGIDRKAIAVMKRIYPKKIVYISCNPVTMARDLNYLSDLYTVKKVIPFDMFPNTVHVECCVLLCRT